MTGFGLASAQLPVADWQRWDDLAGALLDFAADAGDAELLVFPEYAGMLLAELHPHAAQQKLCAQLAAVQHWRAAWLELHREMARRCNALVLAGSLPWDDGHGRFLNRAWLVTPGGRAAAQDKQIMTRFEREHWGIAPAAVNRVFDTDLGCLAVAICYDVEFPLVVRQQVEAGAQLILAPSCTDTQAGYWRVRIGAQARALEGQCVVVQSPLVGTLPASPSIDVNVGAAGVYGPADHGFPPDGVLACGELNRPGWLQARIDLRAVERVRTEGQVYNYRHWSEQCGGSPALPPVERIAL